MIGKLKKGSSFAGCIRYVTGKDEAKIIASDGVLLGTNAEMTQSFELQRQLNPRIKTLNLLDPMFEKLKEAGVEYVVYDGVQPNPTIPNIEAAREMYLKNGCEGFIAFGGGS